ncbi:hypothetical protein SAMN04490207_4881 [Pseudomonas gessardii]|nr:hypothetical protein [Pseudomonas gessardii]SDR30394.1 hypothetical protein SAMN04490207_4881 [Pseudomonas gessardii]
MTYSVDPLREHLIWRRYAYRFLPSFGGAMLLSLFSIGSNTATSLSYFAQISHLSDEIAFAAGITLYLFFHVGQVMLSEGIRYAPRILIPTAVLNILLAAGYLSSHPATLFNLMTLFTSLLYLLVLNSKNHRRYTSMLRVKRRRKTTAKMPTAL